MSKKYRVTVAVEYLPYSSSEWEYFTYEVEAESERHAESIAQEKALQATYDLGDFESSEIDSISEVNP